jgi:hypothetical protein
VACESVVSRETARVDDGRAILRRPLGLKIARSARGTCFFVLTRRGFEPRRTARRAGSRRASGPGSGSSGLRDFSRLSRSTLDAFADATCTWTRETASAVSGLRSASVPRSRRPVGRRLWDAVGRARAGERPGVIRWVWGVHRLSLRLPPPAPRDHGPRSRAPLEQGQPAGGASGHRRGRRVRRLHADARGGVALSEAESSQRLRGRGEFTDAVDVEDGGAFASREA